MTINTRFTRIGLVFLLIAPTPACGQRSNDALPSIPTVRGSLELRVRYPADGATIAAGDSTFFFGSLGDGRATLTIDGFPVDVAPNGAWLAWVAIPRDSAFAMRFEARLGNTIRTATLALRRGGPRTGVGPWVDAGSFSHTGTVWLPDGEPLSLSLRAAPGSRVHLRMRDGSVVPFVADSSMAPVAPGLLAFDRDTANLRRGRTGDRYVGVWRGGSGAETSGMLDTVSAAQTATATLEVGVGDAVVRTPWPIEVRRVATPVAVLLDDDPARRAGTDRTVIGRTTPGGTYAWFFPNGTFSQADARVGNDVRLRLSNDAIAWVPVSEVRRRPAVDDPRPARMGALTLTADSGFVRLRIPLTHPVPTQVDQGTDELRLTLFGAVADADWTRYGQAASVVRLLTWRQVTRDRVELTLRTARPLWGWRLRVEGSDLVLDVRQPPPIVAASPLRGRRVVVDAGHPPLGACGPTGVCEPEVNLAIARRVRDRLVALGAKVTMTRDDASPIGLGARVAIADSVDAEVLISIHNNALPDGVNPFTNNGSSTFFNHPHGLPLASAVQRRLTARLGVRDLGVARGDLALVRPTWYPAILTEGLFLMIPRQEAALASSSGQSLYAGAIIEGLTAWLREMAQPARPAQRP